jgi:hypothetical protein
MQNCMEIGDQTNEIYEEFANIQHMHAKLPNEKVNPSEVLVSVHLYAVFGLKFP